MNITKSLKSIKRKKKLTTHAQIYKKLRMIYKALFEHCIYNICIVYTEGYVCVFYTNFQCECQGRNVFHSPKKKIEIAIRRLTWKSVILIHTQINKLHKSGYFIHLCAHRGTTRKLLKSCEFPDPKSPVSPPPLFHPLPTQKWALRIWQ